MYCIISMRAEGDGLAMTASNTHPRGVQLASNGRSTCRREIAGYTIQVEGGFLSEKSTSSHLTRHITFDAASERCCRRPPDNGRRTCPAASTTPTRRVLSQQTICREFVLYLLSTLCRMANYTQAVSAAVLQRLLAHLLCSLSGSLTEHSSKATSLHCPEMHWVVVCCHLPARAPPTPLL
jgi:hypothetical protein